MNIETWLTFVVASLVLTMTPGPSILLGVVHSMKYGVKKTVVTALGDISANFLQMVLVAIGLGVVIASSELAFLIIKWFGVVTLLYMGLRMLFAKPHKIREESTQTSISIHRLFFSGFFVAAGNPKAIVFFTAFFPQFIDPTQPLFQQMAVMCPTMAFLDFTWVMIYVMSAKKFLGFMHNHPMYLNRIGGSALVLASGFLVSTNRSANV
ncbi:LysE family translocator [Marinobacter halodurans]|uniref:LysE family translocator n=1 Tax=Marinobacter halodurans TaxID=2528979 RepID=A0ABY1ZHG6_9GAMM|nr:LysE family translocator [Marinobacter halodurans]TBW46395.1 LysE family translocator [Marinobacter halodurans]